ncbi:MAG: hypothetical protein OCD01_09850 [Fibrobacterales bacterium]
MLKLKFILIVLLLILFTGCANNSKMIRNDFSKDSKVGRSLFRSGQMEKRWFDEFKMYALQSIGQDEDLTENEKEVRSAEIEKMKWKKNEFAFFTMVNNVPMLKSDRAVNFQISDSMGKNYILDVNLVEMKITEISQYGSYKSFNYTYVINTTPIDLQTIENEKKPVSLKITFNDSKKIEYVF